MNYVCGFLYAEDSVLLLRKNKPEWQKGKLNGVGGKIEPHENKNEAIIREFLEETGRLVKDWVYKVQLCVPKNDAIVYFFSAYCAAMFDVAACDEGELGWYKLTEFQLQKPIPNLNWLVPFCNDLHVEQTRIIQDGNY